METKDYVFIAITLVYVLIVSFQSRIIGRQRDTVRGLLESLERATIGLRQANDLNARLQSAAVQRESMS